MSEELSGGGGVADSRPRSQADLITELAALDVELQEEREMRVYLMQRVKALEEDLEPRRVALIETILQIAREHPDDGGTGAKLMAEAAREAREGTTYPDWEDVRGRLESVENYVRAIIREVIHAEEKDDWQGVLSVCAAALHQLDMNEPADRRAAEHLQVRLEHRGAEGDAKP